MSYLVDKTFSSPEKSRNYQIETSQEKHIEYIPASDVHLNSKVETEWRKRGLYNFPVYLSELEMSGSFGDAFARKKRHIEDIQGFSQFVYFKLVVLVSDPRGLVGIPEVKINGQKAKVNAESPVSYLSSGFSANIPSLENNFNIDVRFGLKGMKTLQFIPVALLAKISMSSSWPHPEFYGEALPLNREIGDDGFKANRAISQFNSGILDRLARCERGDCAELKKLSFGVRLNESVDVYLQSMRATKYAFLFIGLSFITFFIFETLKDFRIHPVQYLLVGVANAIFYLLLIALGEQVSFGVAYFISMLACVGILTYYIRFVVRSWKNTLGFLVLYLTLYSVLYVIVSSEDSALLMGAVLLFVALACIMVVTRDVDWYKFNLKGSSTVLENFISRNSADKSDSGSFDR